MEECTMYLEKYNRWLAQTLEDDDLRTELEAIAGQDGEIEERFAIDLSFGTAGLRGILGAGTNRMNLYTVRRATQGLAVYLLKTAQAPKVAIAYDSRLKSDLFAKEAARVLAANGISVFLYPQLEPVPALSFAVRQLQCDAGIMVTASHNPAKYNGYKVYGADGCQIRTEVADAVLLAIEACDIFEGVQCIPFDKAMAEGLVTYIEDKVLEAFFTEVKKQRVHPNIAKETPLKIVYSPLNGTGNLPVRRILSDIGFEDVTVVPEQEMPNGNFPTAPFPNPEVRESLELGLQLSEKLGADLLLATDPDADRVGIAVRDETGSYQLLSGNEVGVLLLDYICAGRRAQNSLPKRALAVRSLVSTPMADMVAASHGVEMVKVLTGFKYIGEEIAKLEAKNEKERFVFAFEESYGYLAGTHVRDKDGVVASMLICEMAAYHKAQGNSLFAAMQALYAKHGRFLSVIESFAFEGLAGMETMRGIMASLREAPPKEIAGHTLIGLCDYESGQSKNCTTGECTSLDLPASNVLEYHLQGGHSVIVRPSGTEPKVKIYYTTKGEDLKIAQDLQKQLSKAMVPWMK